jgi:flagellar basal body-associated protein FliL
MIKQIKNKYLNVLIIVVIVQMLVDGVLCVVVILKDKEKISEKHKEKVECQCGSIVCKGDIKRHEKTQKHKNFMLSLNKTE